MDRYQYLMLMGACLLVTLPLELVLGARVWRRPGRLVRTLAVPFVLFVVWDVVAVWRGHWAYSPSYVTGWVVGSLPVEELVFFVVIPVCGLLTLEAVRAMSSSGRR
jgi:lycopene cyclase domain-containing protein